MLTALAAARAELFLAPDTRGQLKGDATWKVTQEDLRPELDLQTQAKQWEYHDADALGPYRCAFASNGRVLALAGAKGHTALIDIQKKKLISESQFREVVHDVTFCHDERIVVLAERRCAVMYTNKWAELHQMTEHREPLRLAFLPFHFLLCSANVRGSIAWQDISTGRVVASYATGEGCVASLTRNPWNSVMLYGSRYGSVQMWSPGVNTYLAKIFLQPAAVTSMAVDLAGQKLVAATSRGTVFVYDLRTMQELQRYRTPVCPVDLKISQTGLVGIAYPYRVEFWRGVLGSQWQDTPYMVHRTRGQTVASLQFCPYEDMVGLGLSRGYQSIVVPGCGEANVDSFAPNPLETPKHTGERNVRMLLDKLPPESITLDPEAVGVLRPTPATGEKLKDLVQRQKKMTREVIKAHAKVGEEEEADPEILPDTKGPKKKRKKGKSKSAAVKQKNHDWEAVMRAKNDHNQDLSARREAKQEAAKAAAKAAASAEEAPAGFGALDPLFAARHKKRRREADDAAAAAAERKKSQE